jgi:IPT/TIG domain
VVDAFGNAVTSATNAVAVALATNPGGATLSGTLQLGAVNGVATFADLRIDRYGTGYTLQASNSGLAPVTSTPFDITSAGMQLVFTVQPSNTGAGLPITPAVKVTAEDALGNTVTAFTGTVTIAIGTNPVGGTLSGTLTVAANAGVAAFSDLRIDKLGSGYTLVAASAGLPDATSNSFTITDSFFQLVFMAQPTNTIAGAAISPPVQVCALDAFANVATSFTGNVTLALGNNSNGGTLSGTLTVAAVAGCATFSNLSVDKAGSGYTLLAAAGALAGATSVPFAVTPAAASTIALDGGDQQTAQAGTVLPVPYAVRVADAFGNHVAGVSVDWAVTSGGGSVSPAQSTTDTSGVASTTRTLGPGAGTQTATATAAGLTGSPVTFTATATALTITSISPDTLVEGQSATIVGSGFSPTAGNNTVLVGGVPATVSTASATSLVIAVPGSSCQPARDVGVSVTVGSATSNTVVTRLNPASFLDLAVGQQAIIQDPSRFCLQFRPSAAGGDAYLVGVGAAAEVPSSVLPFALTGVGGASPASAAIAAAPIPGLSAAGHASAGTAGTALAAQQLPRLGGERAIRDWERRHLNPASFNRAAVSAPRLLAVPAVGDTVHFRIPDFSSGNPCTAFTTITTVVRAIGSSGIWVTDTANPTADALTTAEIQGYSDTFDLKIYDVDTTYFGSPSDLDANQRIYIVLTIQVNKDPLGIAGFVFGGDLFDRSFCNQSNGGEIFYGDVPDPNNAAGTGARSKAGVLGQMPSLIAHEFTHDIQLSRRLLLGATTFMSSWEMEGQAVLADEVVGHSVLGNMPGQNYGATVAFGADAGNRWYGFAAAGAFQALPEYYGWLPPGSTTKAANAPELCTLFGTTSLTTNCNPFAFYGASWSLQRYIADRFGAGYPGGEAGINRDLIGKNVTLSGVANVQAVVGVDFDSLFSQWGAMLYVDDRVTGLPGFLTMPSWNLLDVFSAFASDAFRLVPTSRTFTSFSDSRSVRGGSNAYTLLSAAGARSALALRVRDGSGGVLGTAMKPQFWVVRVQ